MATEKRERQRANREQKRAAEQKVQRRKDLLNRVKRIAYFAIGIVAVIFVAASIT